MCDAARAGPSLLAYLLQLLEAPHTIESENVRATIATLVMAIKAMQQKTVKHSERVNGVLEQSAVWKQYRDQSHELFITGSAAPLQLTRAPPSHPSHESHVTLLLLLLFFLFSSSFTYAYSRFFLCADTAPSTAGYLTYGATMRPTSSRQTAADPFLS